MSADDGCNQGIHSNKNVHSLYLDYNISIKYKVQRKLNCTDGDFLIIKINLIISRRPKFSLKKRTKYKVILKKMLFTVCSHIKDSLSSLIIKYNFQENMISKICVGHPEMSILLMPVYRIL